MTNLTAILGGPSSTRSPCVVGTWALKMPQDGQEAVSTALKDDMWQTSSLYRVLRSQGLICSRSTFSLHRRGECNCGR